MRPLSDYRNHSARARRLAFALDRLLAPAAWLSRPPPPPPPRPGERILLVRADHLGDLLMATPALAALRAARPEARIDVLASPWGAAALEGNPHVSRVLTFPATWYEAGRRGTFRWSDLRRTLGELRASAYDIAADLRGDPRIVALLVASRARTRAGFAGLGLERFLGASAALDPRADHRSRNLQVAALLGADAARAPRLPVFVVPGSARDTAERRLADLPRPRIVVAPGTNRPRHTWGAPRFAAATERLVAATGGGVALVGREADREATGRVRGALGGSCLDLTGRTSFAELAGILAVGDLLLANDSGSVHLAAAVGCPVLAVFGATDAALSFPYPAGAGRALSGPSACARPCFRRGCNEDHGYAALDPARVAAEAGELIGARGVA